MGPAPDDAAPLLTQQRVGGDQPPGAARSWQRGRYRAEQAPVGVTELGAVDLAAQHTELVAQHDDLKVLGAPRAHSEANQRNQQAVHEDSASAHIAAGQLRWDPDLSPRDVSPVW